MAVYMKEYIIYAIAQEITKQLVSHFYHSLDLPETSEYQVERIMSELQSRGEDSLEINNKINKIEEWRNKETD